MALAASGSSLRRSDLEACRGRARVIAINLTGELAPWADMLYAADIDFWKAYSELQDFKGEKKVAVNLANGDWRIPGLVQYAMERGIEAVPVVSDSGLSKDDRYIHSGGNSGYQALNIAVLRGARKVLLLGYDMGGPRWHGGHERGLRNTRPEKYRGWIKAFDEAAEELQGVEVINCSTASALTCFPTGRVDDHLE